MKKVGALDLQRFQVAFIVFYRRKYLVQDIKKPFPREEKETFPAPNPALTGLCGFTFLCSNPWLCTE